MALKTLSRLDPAAVYRFKKELRALADLTHPKVVRLHELQCRLHPPAPWLGAVLRSPECNACSAPRRFTMPIQMTGRIARRRPVSQRSSAFAVYGLEMLDLSPDWNEFLGALIARRVRFLLIGGHAVAIHAAPRFTEDLDVFVDPTAANARRLHGALVDFGFGAVAPRPAALAERDKVWMLGRKPLRIDILTGIDGVSFRDAWRERVRVRLGDAEIYVIGRAALLTNKRVAGRAKDLADVEAIEATAKTKRRRGRPH